MKINKTELLKALEVVKPGLASREMIEQSTSFAFLEGRVVTYNDEISISHPVAGIEFSGAVRAEELYKLLNKTKKDEIDLSVEEGELHIGAGRTKAGISFQEVVRLPLEELGDIGEWEEVPEDLHKALQFVQFSCSKDMAGQPVLACVHLRSDGVVESCDNVRLTRYTIGDIPIEDTALIPSTNVKALLGYPFSHMYEGAGWIHFKTEAGTIFSCRVMTGDAYPDIDKSGILEVEGDPVEFPKDLGAVLDRAAIFVNKEYVTGENVSIALSGQKMTIRGQSEVGWLQENAKVKYDGPDTSFLIPPSFLKDLLSQTNLCTIGKGRVKFAGENWEHVAALQQE